MTTETIKLGDIELDVIGNWNKSDGLDAEQILFNGQDVYDLVAELGGIEKIEKLASDKISAHIENMMFEGDEYE
jgi:hypothetical protein